jgi:hypothetical protein
MTCTLGCGGKGGPQSLLYKPHVTKMSEKHMLQRCTQDKETLLVCLEEESKGRCSV